MSKKGLTLRYRDRKESWASCTRGFSEFRRFELAFQWWDNFNLHGEEPVDGSGGEAWAEHWEYKEGCECRSGMMAVGTEKKWRGWKRHKEMPLKGENAGEWKKERNLRPGVSALILLLVTSLGLSHFSFAEWQGRGWGIDSLDFLDFG